MRRLRRGSITGRGVSRLQRPIFPGEGSAYREPPIPRPAPPRTHIGRAPTGPDTGPTLTRLERDPSPARTQSRLRRSSEKVVFDWARGVTSPVGSVVYRAGSIFGVRAEPTRKVREVSRISRMRARTRISTGNIIPDSRQFANAMRICSHLISDKGFSIPGSPVSGRSYPVIRMRPSSWVGRPSYTTEYHV